MFEDFDYKKAVKGGGRLVGGIVKAVSPESGAGVDQAGGGVGDLLAAAGVSLEDPQEKTPPPSKRFDRQDFTRPAPKEAPTAAADADDGPDSDGEPSDRDVTAALLRERGWSADEIRRILAGPQTEAKRVDERPATRIEQADAKTDERTAISNGAAPAKRVPTAAAKRIKK